MKVVALERFVQRIGRARAALLVLACGAGIIIIAKAVIAVHGPCERPMATSAIIYGQVLTLPDETAYEHCLQLVHTGELALALAVVVLTLWILAPLLERRT